MKNILDFIGNHPVIGFFFMAFNLVGISVIIHYITVILIGWPPVGGNDDEEDENSEDKGE